MSPMTLCVAFGPFGTNHPGFGNLHQHDAICFRGGARQPTAFGGVVAKFLSVCFIVFRINFHFEFRITIDSSVFPENRIRPGKVPVQIFALNGTNFSFM